MLLISCWINICGWSKVSCAVIGKACWWKLWGQKDGFATFMSQTLGREFEGETCITNKNIKFSYSICEIHLCKHIFFVWNPEKYGSVKSNVHLADSPQRKANCVSWKRSMNGSDQILWFNRPVDEFQLNTSSRRRETPRGLNQRDVHHYSAFSFIELRGVVPMARGEVIGRVINLGKEL